MKYKFFQPVRVKTRVPAKFALAEWLQRAQFAFYFALLSFSLFYGFSQIKSEKTPKNEKQAAVDAALFARTEFFGADALVPFPTEKARENLERLLQNYPDDAEILLKLAEFDEKLGRFDEAESRLKKIKPENHAALAAFYGRRADFARQAAMLETILQNSSGEKRAAVFSDLINLAKKHDLHTFLEPAFFQKIIASDSSTFSVFRQYIDKLIEAEDYPEALRTLAESEKKFPEMKDYLLETRISILDRQDKLKEAIAAYRAAFDPFWPKEESEKFYRFLSERDSYRAYQTELRKNFDRDPTDFQTAIRLIHAAENDGDEFGYLITRLENARAAGKISWRADELLTVSHFLIKSGDGASAARFLYTLIADFKPARQSDVRRRAIYQLFEIFSDAGDEQLPLTKGDLKFYENVARSDPHPGIATGLLSLIFSDTNPRREFERKERTAVRLFNRAAAFRLFSEFKTQFPASPELAQMYLDVIRLYTKSENLEVAAQTLAEFQEKFPAFEDFPDAGLKLADAFIAVKNHEKEREIYRRLLDHLGQTGRPKFPSNLSFTETKDLTQIKPGLSTYPPQSNPGIRISDQKAETGYYYKPNNFTDYLSSQKSSVSYSDVLDRYVASLARENKIREILDLYQAESAKYPEESELYEQMLQWLGQTNLTEKQLEIYQKALQKFPLKSWQDRFARWLIRQKRQEDFEHFSRALFETFDDARTQEYLRQFIDGKESAKPESFDGKLFFALYTLAHERFPHNIVFTKGLLRYYESRKLESEYNKLLAEYYFESPELRQEFLQKLAKNGSLPEFLKKAENESVEKTEIAALPYKLFRADTAVWLSDFENASVFYRELNALYPNDPQFSENFLTLLRSFGQKDRKSLTEAASLAESRSASFPSEIAFRTRAGEIRAELGDYDKARGHWLGLISLGAGERESYLETATVFWDYFQYDDALKTIQTLREKFKDENLYAFQVGTIYEDKREMSKAVTEYVKALDAAEADQNRAKRRLKELYPRSSLANLIETAFEERRKKTKNSFRLVFNFADMHFQLKNPEKAVRLVKSQIAAERSKENLLEAKQFFRDLEDNDAKRFAYTRLIENASTRRDAITYRLQLAENFSERGENDQAARILSELYGKFPNNYGVLTETENFYWEIGKPDSALGLLRSARSRSNGEFKYRFSRKLAQRLNSLRKYDQAEQILLDLHGENPSDEDVFAELTDVLVRTGKTEFLKKTFAATLSSLKAENLDPREFKWKVDTLQKEMIKALTRLKDHSSAIDQYIEIINREPESEANLEEAIGYVKRYGGAENLLTYYRKTAAESFKNYRWNVVLARIYEASGDLPNAAENYRAAIYNQPEMVELHEALNEIYLKTQNYPAALETIEKMLELSNQDAKYVKQKIKVLEILGQSAEAENEKRKLPAEEIPKPKPLPEQFKEADALRNSDEEKAIAKYREVFENLSASPLENQFQAKDITGYVQTVHRRESLTDIFGKLLKLREKLIAEIETENSLQSRKAQDKLNILDGGILDAVSAEIKTTANGNEILSLRGELEGLLTTTDRHQTSSLLQNLVSRCGFKDLEEKILLAKLRETDTERRVGNLQRLIKIYQERADDARLLELLENETAAFGGNTEIFRLSAVSARNLGDRTRELKALRALFEAQKEDDLETRRFLALIYLENRAELEKLALNPGRHQLQLINFLFSRREIDLARTAIRNSTFPPVWKFSRDAEMSLKFERFAETDESGFVSALGLAPIGVLVQQKTDELNRLAGSDWFKLSSHYGKWLFGAQKPDKAELFLPAMIEKRPHDPAQQFELGYFHLERKNFARALEHFLLADELNPGDPAILPYLGAAFYRIGDREKAFRSWKKMIEGENVSLETASLYLRTLAEFGQAEKARLDLQPLIIAGLRETEKKTEIAGLLKNLSVSLPDDAAKTKYFSDLCRKLPENTIVPAIVIEQRLTTAKDFAVFYRFLIDRSESFDDYEHDYDFVRLLEAYGDPFEAEWLLDSENDFKIEEPGSDRLTWQKNFLEFLLENRDYAAAENLTAAIESSLKGQYARPVWLRLAKIELLLARNNTAAFLLLKKFVGIDLSPNAADANPPALERLNEALKMLEAENLKELSLDLRESFYARQIALEQYEAAGFAGLIRIAIARGDLQSARRLLQIMADFAAEERRAELAALPLIAKFSEKDKMLPEPRNSIKPLESLKLAAEIATQSGLFSEAFEFRGKLLSAEPFDISNRLERARLAAKIKSVDETSKILLEIISDKNSGRSARWQALIVLSETLGANGDAWQKIKSENSALANTDAEMWNALEALRLSQTGFSNEAVTLLESSNYTPELKFLKAVLEKNTGRFEAALRDFTELSFFQDELTVTFGFWEAAPVQQTIRLYLQTGKPLAATVTAKNLDKLKTVTAKPEVSVKAQDSSLRILADRREYLTRTNHRQILELLSKAAEEISEFSSAVEFETSFAGFLETDEERNASQERLKTLERKSSEQKSAEINFALIDENFLSKP